MKIFFNRHRLRPKVCKNCFVIAGTHSGVGKTTIAIGLMSALRKRGAIIQPFKVGPDYIDPSYHRAVCRRPSYNLDTWMMEVDGVKRTFVKAMHLIPPHPPLLKGGRGDFLGIIEGVMGLFDGRDGKSEEGSTSHVAKVLGVPVILVVDARSMARSAGALVYGYEKFDPKVNIAGVILNRVGSERHFKMLKHAVETKCRARVLGYIPRDEEISLPERHLGLVMAGETGARFKKLRELIERFVDIDGILRIAGKAKKTISPATHRLPLTACIAVAMDDAFCFYYQENLDMLKELGAKLVFFSPLKDKRLPENIDGIYLGGGYPELFAKQLEVNKPMRKVIRAFADKGFPIYAECGGLMYLGKGLKDLTGKEYEMAGVFPWVSRMLEKRKSLGYREVKAIDSCPFLKKGEKIRGHEYHYSEIDEPSNRIKRVYRITHNPPSPPFNKGGQVGVEGYLYKNTLASYIHLHFASNPKFAEGFIKLCIRNKCKL